MGGLGMTVNREAVAAWLARTCADQGVAVKVTDPAVLGLVRDVLASGVPRGRARGTQVPRTPRGFPAPTPAT